MLRRICVVGSYTVLVAIFCLFVVYTINFFRPFKKINTEQYLRPRIDLASIPKKDFWKDFKKDWVLQETPMEVKLYQQKIWVHICNVQEMIVSELKDLKDDHILEHDLLNNFVRIISKWTKDYKDADGDIYEVVYHIYIESMSDENELFLSTALITPVVIWEYQTKDKKTPNNTKIELNDGNTVEVMANEGYLKTGIPDNNWSWFVYPESNCPDIDKMESRLITNFCNQLLDKKY